MAEMAETDVTDGKGSGGKDSDNDGRVVSGRRDNDGSIVAGMLVHK
jgi:hypothetical protein